MLPESILGETFLEKYIDHNDAVTIIDEKRTYVVRAPANHPIYENFRVKVSNNFHFIVSNIDWTTLEIMFGGYSCPCYF